MGGAASQLTDAQRAAIDKVATANMSTVPESMRNDLTGSFDNAAKAFGMLDAVVATSTAIDERAKTYAPLHHEVRDIQETVRRNRATIVAQKYEIRLLDASTPDAAQRKAAIEAEISALEAEDKRIADLIPADWERRHAAFRALLTEDRKARLTYRRTVDTAYEPVIDAVRTIEGAATLAALKPELESLRGIIESQPEDKAAESVEAVLGRIGAVNGASDLRSQFYQAKRALTGRSPNRDTAIKAFDKAMASYAAETAWRQKAAQDVLPGLKTYERAIHDSIGLRKQEKLPQYIVPSIAQCTATPRDVSMYF